MAPNRDIKASGRTPAKTLHIPEEYRRETLLQEEKRLIDTWKKETTCEVVPTVIMESPRRIITQFRIFGTGSGGVDKAVKAINDWILATMTKSSGSGAWAKLEAWEYNKWYDNEVRKMENARKQRYKRPVPQGTELPPFKIVVEWPNDLWDQIPPLLPRDAFGARLEVLDPIRLEHEVYIAEATTPRWAMEIYSYESARAEAAEAHTKGAIEKVRTMAFNAVIPLHIVLDLESKQGNQVQLQRAEGWWPQHNFPITARLIHSTGKVFRAVCKEGLSTSQLTQVQHAIQSGLETVRYEKGFFDLCIRYGSFALSPKLLSPADIGKVFSLEKFMNGINGNIDCETKRWFSNDQTGHEVLTRLEAARGLLEPIKSAGLFGYMPPSLEDTRPIFRATFVFQDPSTLQSPAAPPGRPNIRQPSNIQKCPQPLPLMVVQIDWTDDEEGLYEKMEPPRYYQLKPGQWGPKQNLDIKLLELRRGKAWQVSLESMIPLPRKSVPPMIHQFAQSVQMKSDYNYDVKSNELFALWGRSPGLKLEMGRLDAIYSFGIRGTAYKVETLRMWYSGSRSRDPCWGINVRHNEWASHLSELEQLSLGRRAEWGKTITTFLPDDGCSGTKKEEVGVDRLKLDDMSPARGGIRILTDKLTELSRVINGANN